MSPSQAFEYRLGLNILVATFPPAAAEAKNPASWPPPKVDPFHQYYSR
jgi:hypothetical protein